jgi:hypothetical protein
MSALDRVAAPPLRPSPAVRRPAPVAVGLLPVLRRPAPPLRGVSTVPGGRSRRPVESRPAPPDRRPAAPNLEPRSASPAADAPGVMAPQMARGPSVATPGPDAVGVAMPRPGAVRRRGAAEQRGPLAPAPAPARPATTSGTGRPGVAGMPRAGHFPSPGRSAPTEQATFAGPRAARTRAPAQPVPAARDQGPAPSRRSPPAAPRTPPSPAAPARPAEPETDLPAHTMAPPPGHRITPPATMREVVVVRDGPPTRGGVSPSTRIPQERPVARPAAPAPKAERRPAAPSPTAVPAASGAAADRPRLGPRVSIEIGEVRISTAQQRSTPAVPRRVSPPRRHAIDPRLRLRSGGW